MSRPSRRHVQDDAAEDPAASRLQRLASTAWQVALTVLATVAAGLYVFPLH